MGKNYENKELEKAVNLANSMGLKVWTFETNRNYISQVFFDDGIAYGTASASYGGLSYGTCHKACRECGTGFGMGNNIDCDIAHKDAIKATLSYAPGWAVNKGYKVIKESFEQHIKNSNLKYYEL